MLRRFLDVELPKFEEVQGPTDLVRHEIHLLHSTPIKQRYRPQSGGANESKKVKSFEGILCLFCGEMYIEDWIRCDVCYKWCLEKCSAFESFGR